ncbi:MAG: T9SS type A sorting domain-containing protein [Candidatus Anstonellales archaeon]
MRGFLFTIFFFVLSYQLLFSQQPELRLITDLPIDCKNPTLSKEITTSDKWLFFEGWSNYQNSKLFIFKYDANSDSFIYFSMIGNDSSKCELPKQEESYQTHETIVIWQHKQNKSYDLAASSVEFSPPWSNYIFLTNFPEDETKPSFSYKYFMTGNGILLTYEKNSSAYILYSYGDLNKSELIFQSTNDTKYENPSGWIFGFQDGNIIGYIAAVEKKENSSKIVYRYKIPPDTMWSDIYVAFDSGYCSNPKFFNSALTFESIINGKKQIYYFESKDDFGKNYKAKRINFNDEYETSDLDLLLISDSNVIPSHPLTYKLIKNDSTFIYLKGGKINNQKDTLIYIKYKDSHPAIGVIDYQDGIFILKTITIWEDSLNGKLALFGIEREIPYGTINVREMNPTKDFILYQNYPNPFNSKTKIKFLIPNSGPVSLKIYNLLGQEIATLVNETKQIGEYEIEFDGDQYNLSSGVYIYQLKNNSLVQSKKFILMK